jgi:hypothetical protein
VNRIKRPWSWAVLAVVVSLDVGGCGNKQPGDAAAGSRAAPMAKSSSDEFHYDDPCSLLEPKEVEAVLGAPLGTAPYRTSPNGMNRPTASGEDCIYQTSDFHTIELSVDFKDGAQAYRVMGFGKKLVGAGAPNAAIKKAFTLDDGTELAGEWDEAQLMAMTCCIFNALRGDQMISVDFTGSDATLRQAAGLVDAAFKRIDKPLKIDGGAGLDAARALINTRPKPVDVCTLLTRAEAEAIIGPLSGDPVSHGTDECTYPVPPINGVPRVYDLNVKWDGGYAKWRTLPHIVNMVGNAMAIKGDTQSPEPANAEEAPGPGDAWAHAGVVFNDFVIVKKDVEVRLDLRGLDRDAGRRLVAAAARKI